MDDVPLKIPRNPGEVAIHSVSDYNKLFSGIITDTDANSVNSQVGLYSL